MDKLRNIKNRLSMSVDKLSPSRRSKSQQRKSEPLGNVPASMGDIPGSVRTSRVDDRPSSAFEVSSTTESKSRPSSYCEVDMDESLSEEWLAVEDIPVSTSESKSPPDPEVEDSSRLSVDNKPLKRSTPTIHGDSLMSEVMKEVEKISEMSETMKTERPKNYASVEEGATSTSGTQQEAEAGAGSAKALALSDPGLSTSEETLVAAEEVMQNEDTRRTTQDGLLNLPSACRTESLTSGYFSDSDVTLSDGRCDSSSLQSPLRVAENAEQNKSAFRSVISESQSKSAFSSLKCDSSDFGKSSSKTEDENMSLRSSAFTQVTSEERTITAYSTTTTMEETKPAESETPTKTTEKKAKKESLYSRIMKKKDSSKEPIYAKIKPKLTLETSFQPIEPSSVKNTWHGSGPSGVVKPEPVYGPATPRAAAVPTSPTASPAAYTPPQVEPSTPDKKDVPIYSKVKPRESRSNTLPREALYSTVKKNTASLPKELSQTKVKEHIYNTPLPPTPREEALLRRESFYSNTSSDYGKVTVRVGEITPKVPAIITIHNPGYAAPSVSTLKTSPPPASSPESPAPSTAPSISSSKISDPAATMSQSETEDKSECVPKTATSRSSEQRNVQNGDPEREDRARLNQLVEELAQELEAVTMKYDPDAAADYKSKKEILAKLLSTYDVPKNLRRVEEVDEEAALEAEQALVPASVSMDELRYVDDNEDNAETVYADVPDYSQDEFVIALDDENDPRYASLTRAIRQQKAGGESPGKVSKKSATMYANALNVVTALKVLINSKSTRAASVINKMGTLARPYTHRMQGTITDTSWIQRVIYHKSVSGSGSRAALRTLTNPFIFCLEYLRRYMFKLQPNNWHF